MKPNQACKSTALVALFAFTALFPAIRIQGGTSLTLVPSANLTNGNLSVNDPSNQTWVISVSTDMSTWNEIAAWKVYNGSFHTNFPYQPGTGPFFFRATFDPARQTNIDTSAAALLLPDSPFNFANPSLPPNYLVPPISQEDNTPTNNPVTDTGAALGRVLFYDKRLSTNQTVACSSCHQQQFGFSDPRRFSTGFDGSVGTRNAMGLTQARYYQRAHFFWDERAATLEAQTLQPIQNPIEMGMTLPTLVTRLSAEPFYSDLFNQAFGSPDVTTNRISFALAQFVRSMISTNSKYDAGLPVGFSNFTPQENLGRQIFFGQTTNHATCAVCHAPDTFSAVNIFNNGLEFPYVDSGVGGITGRPQDMGLFKVPSLRNIELTAPYMHDGRFATLEQVVDFYNAGIVDNPNLSPPLRIGRPPQPPGGPLRLNLSADQKAALVAFLKTFTDTSLTTDPKFSDPFNYGN